MNDHTIVKRTKLSRTVILTALLIILGVGVGQDAWAARTTWHFDGDRSWAITRYAFGEIVVLPLRGGGIGYFPCMYPGGCWTSVRDYKVGTVDGLEFWWAPNGMCTMCWSYGNMSYQSATFEINVSPGFDGLFPHTVVSAQQMSSSGFEALVGAPGDQIPQGGTLSYSNQWYSDQAIGVDPATGDDVILGHFVLELNGPPASFEVTQDSLSYTAAEVYRLSTGVEWHGIVESQGPLVPEQ